MPYIGVREKRRILNKLQKAKECVDTLVSPKHELLDPKCHAAADTLHLYIQTWIQLYLDQAIAELSGVAEVEDYR